MHKLKGLQNAILNLKMYSSSVVTKTIRVTIGCTSVASLNKVTHVGITISR